MESVFDNLGELSGGEIRDAPDERGPYIVMEYVPGIDLAELIREQAPLPPAPAVSIALSTARGLGAATQTARTPGHEAD